MRSMRGSTSSVNGFPLIFSVIFRFISTQPLVSQPHLWWWEALRTVRGLRSMMVNKFAEKSKGWGRFCAPVLGSGCWVLGAEGPAPVVRGWAVLYSHCVASCLAGGTAGVYAASVCSSEVTIAWRHREVAGAISGWCLFAGRWRRMPAGDRFAGCLVAAQGQRSARVRKAGDPCPTAFCPPNLHRPFGLVEPVQEACPWQAKPPAPPEDPKHSEHSEWLKGSVVRNSATSQEARPRRLSLAGETACPTRGSKAFRAFRMAQRQCC